jgi:hypothetical protein
MSDRRWDRIAVASTAFALLLAAAPGALAQDGGKPDATFNERYPAEQPKTAPIIAPKTSPEIAAETASRMAEPAREHDVARPVRMAGTKRPRSRVVVEPRSFLDAGTEVLPGQRKFLDYALPPTHTPMDVVQNTGGRVGWHNSPLPGPFFPW